MIAVAGAGAFGTALAVTLARAGRPVVLWARDPDQADALRTTRRNPRHLTDVELPDNITVTADMADVADADTVLLAVPTQALRMFLAQHAPVLDGMPLVACCKGLDLRTWTGPSAMMANACPRSVRSVLTGPGFAVDIARGLPTALTLAGGHPDLQRLLSTPTLRLYATDDLIGAEFGGALKNVIAIASGIVTGAGLGASARAALLARGFAEMTRLAIAMGGRGETLAGLSGLGDLVLTATSAQSRNFCHGVALGEGAAPTAGVTVEGVATAIAVAELAKSRGVDMPVSMMTAALIEKKIDLSAAIKTILSRPLKQE